MPAAPFVVAALLLGVATVFGFAPFGFWELPVLTLAALFLLWRQSASPQIAAWIGFAFGAGLFGVGASWVYIALALFGGMQGVLAGLATFGFCAYLALFPALAGWASARLAPKSSNARLSPASANSRAPSSMCVVRRRSILSFCDAWKSVIVPLTGKLA